MFFPRSSFKIKEISVGSDNNGILIIKLKDEVISRSFNIFAEEVVPTISSLLFGFFGTYGNKLVKIKKLFSIVQELLKELYSKNVDQYQ